MRDDERGSEHHPRKCAYLSPDRRRIATCVILRASMSLVVIPGPSRDDAPMLQGGTDMNKTS